MTLPVVVALLVLGVACISYFLGLSIGKIVGRAEGRAEELAYQEAQRRKAT